MPIRTLYIGLGGAGARSILYTKKCFVDAYGEVPPMVGFLAIDTDTAIEQLEFKSRKGRMCHIGTSSTYIVAKSHKNYGFIARMKKFICTFASS